MNTGGLLVAARAADKVEKIHVKSIAVHLQKARCRKTALGSSSTIAPWMMMIRQTKRVAEGDSVD